LSQPDSAVQAERLNALPRLPREKEGPVFAEPWEAHAFALAVKLSEQGHFTWSEWARALGDELKAAADRGEPDDGSHYYEHWLAALEQLVTAKGLTDRGGPGNPQGSLGRGVSAHAPWQARRISHRGPLTRMRSGASATNSAAYLRLRSASTAPQR